MHQQLVEWLAMLGLRTQTAAADELAALDRAIEVGPPLASEELEPTHADRDGAAARLSASRDR